MSKKNRLVDFRAIRESVTMEAVLKHYGLLDPMKRSGDSLSGCCPIHKGTNPTQFRVSVSKNLWNCFSECKHGGNVLDFIARMEDVSAYGAAQKAIEWFQLDPERVYAEGTAGAAPENASNEPAPKAKPDVKAAPTMAAKPEGNAPNPPLNFRLDKLHGDHPYLLERGLTPETVASFGVGFCMKGMLAGHIAIPIHNSDGQIVAYAGRHVGDPPEGTPKYKLPPGFRKSLELFNLDRAKRESPELPWVIVEGFFDAMKLHQLGHRKVVALMGSSLSTAQEELLRRHTDWRSQVLVMLDEDNAGRAARGDLAARIARFTYVGIHAFGQEGQQPEHLTAEQLQAVLGGVA